MSSPLVKISVAERLLLTYNSRAINAFLRNTNHTWRDALCIFRIYSPGTNSMMKIRSMHQVDPSLDLRDEVDRTDFFEAAKAKVESHGIALHSVFRQVGMKLRWDCQIEMRRSRRSVRCSEASVRRASRTWDTISNRWGISAQRRRKAEGARRTVRLITMNSPGTGPHHMAHRPPRGRCGNISRTSSKG